MIASPSKSTRLYGQMRRALQCGRFVPGQRLEPAALADEFDASLTPVRAALHRLHGEGLVIDKGRDGFYMPMPTEATLRGHYEFMELLLLAACDKGASPNGRRHAAPAPGEPVAQATWQLFDTIGRRTPLKDLQHTMQLANDRLAPIRTAKQPLVRGGHAELAELVSAWERADLAALKSALRAYHAQRRQMVPAIVELLNDVRDALH